MEFYYYSTLFEGSNIIKKEKIIINEKKLRDLWNEIFNEYSKHSHHGYNSFELPNFINETLQDKNIEIDEAMVFDTFIINNFSAKLASIKTNIEDTDKKEMHIEYDEYSIPYLCQLIDKLISGKGKDYNKIMNELEIGSNQINKNEIIKLELEMNDIFQEMINTEDDTIFNDRYEEIKNIENKITKLRNYDEKIEHYFKEVINSIQKTYIDSIPVSIIDKIQSFFSSDNNLSNSFENDEIEKTYKSLLKKRLIEPKQFTN